MSYEFMGDVNFCDSKRQEMASDATIRDYFAAKAMNGLVVSGLNSGAWNDYDDMAKSAYGMADAMLKARGE